MARLALAIISPDGIKNFDLIGYSNCIFLINCHAKCPDINKWMLTKSVSRQADNEE